MTLPFAFEEIMDKIARLTGMPAPEIAWRPWMEALQPGWHVTRDAQAFGVTPFVHNDRMEQYYRDGDGFLFDCLVYWGAKR